MESERDQLNETVSLDLEESNDLTFKIKMEGAASSPAKVRLVCEGNDFSYMFNGYGTGEDEVVQFTIPKMSSKLTEGTYSARVEVLVENRYFAPLHFQINFKKMLSVVAESIKVSPKSGLSDIKVTAAPVASQKPIQPQPSKIKFEQRPEPAVPSQTISETAAPSVPVPAKTSPLRDAYMKKISTTNDGTPKATTGSHARKRDEK